MSDQPLTPDAPANATEAASRLSNLTADKAWSGKLLSGDVATSKEFHDLTTMVAEGGDKIDIAMAGLLPDVPSSEQRLMAGTAAMLRELGIDADTIRQTLSGHEVTKAEFDAVQALKTQLMRSPEFTKLFLAGEPEAVKKMALADIVLSSTIKREAAA